MRKRYELLPLSLSLSLSLSRLKEIGRLDVGQRELIGGGSGASKERRSFGGIVRGRSAKTSLSFYRCGEGEDRGVVAGFEGTDVNGAASTMFLTGFLAGFAGAFGGIRDDSLPENSALIDEQLEATCEDLNGRNKNQGLTVASGGSSSRKLEREEPTRRQRKQNSILRRKSLTGAGTVWESGVRRSTRIRMKPLKHWCGERFLYARIHDSLATVIGVKKFETPQNGRKTVMKVKSYVSDQYADLVAQAALH